jgi:DNA-binding transcriptional LysR family regulator
MVHPNQEERIMALHDITLVQLRALVAVQRQGSITAAAGSLKVTQPVLTRVLRQLEQQVGVVLLHRSARGASLTEYGEALVVRAARIEEEMQRARDELRQMQGQLSGRLAIACSPIPMMLFVPRAIGQFRKTFSEVEVRITEAVYPDLIDEFRMGRIDFAIGPIPDRGLGRDFKTSKLLDTELVVAVRAGHAKAQVRTLSEFSDEGWMVMGPPRGPGAITEKVFGQHGLKAPGTPLYLETVWSALEVIKHTDVIGFIPRPLAEAASGAIRIVPVRESLPQLKIHAITPAKAILTPAARALMSAIRASAGRG